MDSGSAYIYAGAGTPAEQVSLSAGTVTYLLADQLGSVRVAISPAGAVTGTASYDAWGNPTAPGGLTTTPFGFAGGYTDPDGLLYLLNRYYNPATGAFLSVDPMLSQTLQPYEYADDNPVTSTDPTGLWTGIYYGPPSSIRWNGSSHDVGYEFGFRTRGLYIYLDENATHFLITWGWGGVAVFAYYCARPFAESGPAVALCSIAAGIGVGWIDQTDQVGGHRGVILGIGQWQWFWRWRPFWFFSWTTYFTSGWHFDGGLMVWSQ
jgi:RHS repeat-associated protein